MRRPAVPRREGSLVVAALLAASCSPTASGAPTLERLLPALGEPSFVRIHDETRPAVELGPGEARSCRVDVERGSRLVFAVGVPEGARKAGAFQLTVAVDGKPVFDERVSVTRAAARWQHHSAPVEAAGRVGVEVKVGPVRGLDTTGEGPDAPRAVRVALGSPRLYRPARGARRRTLLWLSQDALRADHLGAYGYPRPTSPNFDRIASGWGLFEDPVAPASWTLPSLASQMTSRYPTYHGAVLTGLATDDPSVFEVLAKEGFTVLGVTGNDVVSSGSALARGFDALRHAEIRADRLNSLVLAAVDEWGGGDLALFVHYIDPHASYHPPPPFDQKFDPGYQGEFNGGADFFKRASKITPADREHLVALYDGEIASQDKEIAALLERLEGMGILDGAVIAYTADHGEEFQEHGWWSHGTTLYQEVLRIPLAVRIPGVAPQRVKRPVSLLDLAPTVLDAFGIEAPPSFQGRSLLPLLRGGSPPEEPVYAETQLTRERSHLVAVRSGPLKYVLTVRGGRDTNPSILREELYDLGADPGEKTNLGPTHAEAQRLRRYALAYLSRARSEGHAGRPVPVDESTLQKLKAWGYIE